MKITFIYPLRYVASILWVGFLIAISFMEAPLKFTAPGVTLAIGLGIGKIIFYTLNKMEWAMLVLVAFSFVFGGSTTKEKVILTIIIILLLSQTFLLLPALTERANIIINQGSLPSSSLHFYYIGLEVIKLGLLSLITFQFIKRQSNEFKIH